MASDERVVGVIEVSSGAGLFEDTLRYWLRIPMRCLMVELLRRALIGVSQCTESKNGKSGARLVLPKAPLVLKCATLQNLTPDKL